MDTCTSGAQRKEDRAIGSNTTTSNVGRIRRKSAAVSDQPELEQEQPSMKEITVKFGEVQRGVDGHKISFSPGALFLVMSRRIVRRISSLI